MGLYLLVNKLTFMKDVVAQWEHAGLASQSSVVRDLVGNNNFLRIVVICEEGESEFGVIGVWERGREIFKVGNMLGICEFYFFGVCNFKSKRKVQ